MNTPGTHRAGCTGCYPHMRVVRENGVRTLRRVNVKRPHGWTGVTYDGRRQPGRSFGPAPKRDGERRPYASPRSTNERLSGYMRENGAKVLTARQMRRLVKKSGFGRGYIAGYIDDMGVRVK